MRESAEDYNYKKWRNNLVYRKKINLERKDIWRACERRRTRCTSATEATWKEDNEKETTKKETHVVVYSLHVRDSCVSART